MDKRQYGKIINGQLMKAPLQITDNGCAYSGVPDEIYRKYGYKPLVFMVQPENIPFGSKPTYRWEETAETIQQTWSFEPLPDDYAEQLRKSKGQFNSTLRRLKEGLHNYCTQQHDKMLDAIHQDSIIEEAYSNLISSGNYDNIGDAMKQYKTSVPCDFFRAVGVSDYLKRNGYILNTSGKMLFFYDETSVIAEQQFASLNFADGKVYESTGREVYPVSSFSAIKFTPVAPPIVIDPMMLFFALRQIAELYESFHASNLYFTMVFTYLHTAMDAFMTSLIRFYVCSYPEGAEFSKDVSCTNVLSIKSMEDLLEFKNKIIEDKVAGYGHGSYQDKLEFLTKRGINFTVSQTMWHDDMIWFCEKRNAIVHNASIVNQVILKKLHGTIYHDKVSLGEDVSPDYDTLMDTITLVETVCNDIYNAAKSKFKI